MMKNCIVCWIISEVPGFAFLSSLWILISTQYWNNQTAGKILNSTEGGQVLSGETQTNLFFSENFNYMKDRL